MSLKSVSAAVFFCIVVILSIGSGVLEFLLPESSYTGKLMYHRKLNRSQTFLSDILFTVKTGKTNHQRRLDLILKTWYEDVSQDQIFIVTDENDPIYQKRAGNRLVNTTCGTSHARDDLCCKTGVEFDLFLSSNKKWWCHVDDDNYVNVYRLVEILNRHLWNDTVYVGRRSRNSFRHRAMGKYIFGTGGAGFCITRSLADKMAPICGKGKFVDACHKAFNSDDCTIGFIITNLLNIEMSESMSLHSHIENLGSLVISDILEAGTLSYSQRKTINLPSSDMTFSKEKDPTRLLSVHCWLHPHLQMCRNLAES